MRVGLSEMPRNRGVKTRERPTDERVVGIDLREVLPCSVLARRQTEGGED